VFQRANLTGLLANDIQLEGVAVRIRRSFVSIVAPLAEGTGGAAGRRHGCRSRPGTRTSLGRVEPKAPPVSSVSGAQ